MAKSKTASSEAIEHPAEETAAAIDTIDDQEPSALDTERYLRGLIEALLFVTDRPLELKELARAAKIDRKRCAELLQMVRDDFAARGMRVDEVAGGYMFRTNPAYASYVQNFLAQRPVRLSRAQLETLAIVAYRQPITRPEVDDIRGVDCGPVLKGLLERDLIRILGKKDEPGRPMLYGTTQNFLELFSLQSLRELPTLREFTELSDESRRVFEREMGEDAPEGPFELGDSEGGELDAAHAAAASSEASRGGSDATLDASKREDDENEDEDDEDEDEDDENEDEDDEDEDDDDEDDEDEDDDDDEES